jgi:hypothetical protein
MTYSLKVKLNYYLSLLFAMKINIDNIYLLILSSSILYLHLFIFISSFIIYNITKMEKRNTKPDNKPSQLNEI